MPALPDGRRLNQIAACQHDLQVAGDYRRLKEAGLLTVREAARWPLIDRQGRLSFEALEPAVSALRQEGLVAIWDLFHYGFPPDVDLFGPEFPRRFAAYCRGVARFLAAALPGPRFYTPINEISYFSYAAGEIGYFAPFAQERGKELKRQLVRAALEAVAAIRAEDPGARFVHADPLIHLVPPADRPELAPQVAAFNREVVYEAWLMLAGRKQPELGGSEATLDIAGVNLYPICQWEYERPQPFLQPEDPRWLPLRELLQQAWERLGHPLLITETGANGPERPHWLRSAFEEVLAARAAGVPLYGICWYPVVSCPDWHDPTSIFPAGLWDAIPAGRQLRRAPCAPALVALREAQRELAEGRPSGRSSSEASPHGAAPPIRIDQLRIADAQDCPTSPENFAEAFLLAGEELAVRSYRLLAGQEVSIRAYSESESALCVLEGEVMVEGWSARITLRQGQVIVVPAGAPFGMRNDGTGPALLLQVSSPPPWSADFQGREPGNCVMG